MLHNCLQLVILIYILVYFSRWVDSILLYVLLSSRITDVDNAIIHSECTTVQLAETGQEIG